MSVNYYEPNAKEVASAAEGGFSGDDFAVLKDGDNFVRVLPPWSAAGKIGIKVAKHYDMPPDSKILYCAVTWADKFQNCPICDTVNKFAEDMDTSPWWADTKYYVNALIYDANENLLFPKPKILRLPWIVYSWINQQISNPRIGNITNPVSGYDIQINKSGKGRNTKYVPQLLPNKKPIADSDEKMVALLKGLFNLDSIFKTPEGMEGLWKQYSESLTFHLASLVETAKDDDKAKAKSKASAPAQKPAETKVETKAEAPKAEEKKAEPKVETKAEEKKVEVKSEAPKAEEKKPEPKVDTPPSAPRTDGKPECYGMKNSVPVESRKKCVPCPHEVECIEATEKNK